MSRSELYRKRAREAGALAVAASGPNDREYYMRVAMTWNDMAQRVELFEGLFDIPSGQWRDILDA